MLCTRCKTDKPVDSFRPSEIKRFNGVYGNQYKGLCICSVCLKESARKTYLKHYASRRERANNYNQNHKEEKKIYDKKRYPLIRDNHLKNMKEHYKNNMFHYDYWRSKACAKKHGATEFMTFQEWSELRSGMHCHWCQIKLHASFTHVDHVKSLADGGQHTRSNVVLSCANCNMSRDYERKVVYDFERQFKR